ncbi:sodium-dependent phosphate transporter 1-B-like [Tropilaelaps mercedesae]|uniref:Phosphate transporter n=1 Tax=Tropilaelaps mercedesae TaxID=418985 RepID=A0A1V9WYH0_9ACAR|nr:sodium-dependent phosphate transporter 1-B-like [Tropilaelaps mercedesae]
MDLVSAILPTLKPDDLENMLPWILIAGFVVCFFLAFGVGANDVASFFGTSVGAKALKLRQALIMAMILETLSAILIGYRVSDTVPRSIFDVNIYHGDEKLLMLGCLSALLASAVWTILATALALPISSTHSIVGAIIGFTMVAKGCSSVRWSGVVEAVISCLVSPVLSGLISISIFSLILKFIVYTNNAINNALLFLPFFYFGTFFVNFFSLFLMGPHVFKFHLLPTWIAFLISIALALGCAVFVRLCCVPRIKTIIENTVVTDRENVKHKTHSIDRFVSAEFSSEEFITADCNLDESKSNLNNEPEVNELFSTLQVLTALFGVFAYGGNDASNATGLLLPLWIIYHEGSVAPESESPFHILLFSSIGICVGLWVYGQKVIKTIGERLTRISAMNGFSVEVGSASTALAASIVGLPTSMTYCKVVSVMFVGYFIKNSGGVDWKVFKDIVATWLCTLPITAMLSAGIMYILTVTV